MRRRHPDVDDGQVRIALADELEQLTPAARLADDIEPGPFEQTRETFAQQDVVVGDDDATACPVSVCLRFHRGHYPPMRRLAVVSRTMSRVNGSRCSVSTASFRISRTRRSTAVTPISLSGWRTVVSAGWTTVA